MRTAEAKHPGVVPTDAIHDNEDLDISFQESEQPGPPLLVDEVPDVPFQEGAHDTLTADMRHRLISEAAYRLYAERGYADGYDVDDWLQAEAQVDHILLNPTRSSESSR